jgi:hypothetical protein
MRDTYSTAPPMAHFVHSHRSEGRFPSCSGSNQSNLLQSLKQLLHAILCGAQDSLTSIESLDSLLQPCFVRSQCNDRPLDSQSCTLRYSAGSYYRSWSNQHGDWHKTPRTPPLFLKHDLQTHHHYGSFLRALLSLVCVRQKVTLFRCW